LIGGAKGVGTIRTVHDDREHVDPLQRLRWFIRTFVKVSAHRPELLRIVDGESTQASERLDYLCATYEHVDELVDHLVHGQRKLAIEPCNADLLRSADESVRLEPQLLRWREGIIVGGEGEPELDCARREFIAVLLEQAGLGLDGEQPHHPRIAQERARVDRQGGPGVATGSGLDRRSNRCDEIARHVFEYGVGECVD
jgi:hypothetical protein